MKYVYLFALVVVLFFLMSKREAFGLSGYTNPVDIKLDDPRPDLSKYTKVETSVDNDMVQDFVLLANKEIFKRTGVSTYIIETTSVKKYRGEENDVYECMFMVVKNSGFAFGFSVVASFEVKGSKIRLVSLRSQPLGVQAPSNVAAYTEGSEGKEFIDYKLVKEKSVPCKSELDSVKNKLK